jgi:hypothetical protein
MKNKTTVNLKDLSSIGLFFIYNFLQLNEYYVIVILL